MKKFYDFIAELATKRTEKIDFSLYVKIQNEKINWSEISDEEKAIIKQRILVEASYLRGIIDGIQMTKIV